MSEAAPSTMTAHSPGMRIASRRAFVHALVTAAVLSAGIVSVHGLERALHATFDKPPAPLLHPLDEVQRRLGDPVRYEAVGPDQVLAPEIVETLGTADYLVREYRDRNVADGQRGGLFNLNVNYYATGSSTPHVPETCWAGAGRVESDDSRVVFDVDGVKRRDGSLVNLRVKLVSFLPTNGDAAEVAALTTTTSEPIYSNVAYVFQVNGEYVTNTREVSSHFWKASNRYAYHAKIEVTPMVQTLSGYGQPNTRPMVGTQKEAIALVSDFLRSAVPAVEECLPDPAILTADPDAKPDTSKTR